MALSFYLYPTVPKSKSESVRFDNHYARNSFEDDFSVMSMSEESSMAYYGGADVLKETTYHEDISLLSEPSFYSTVGSSSTASTYQQQQPPPLRQWAFDNNITTTPQPSPTLSADGVTDMTKSLQLREDVEEDVEEKGWDTMGFRGPTPHIAKCLQPLVVLFSAGTIAICVFLLIQLGQTCDHYHGDETMRAACEDLTGLFPLTTLYNYTDDITNQRFKDARILRIHGKGKVECEVPMSLVYGRLARQDLDLVDAEVNLQAGDKGPVMPFSKYNLLISDSKLKRMDADRQYVRALTSGLYFIYFRVQLVYGEPLGRPNCRDLEHKTSVIHLLRYRASERVKREQYSALLRSEHTCCFDCQQEKSTGFTGGLFHLSKDDRLGMQVSAPGILGQSQGNLLGAVKMSEMN